MADKYRDPKAARAAAAAGVVSDCPSCRVSGSCRNQHDALGSHLCIKSGSVFLDKAPYKRSLSGHKAVVDILYCKTETYRVLLPLGPLSLAQMTTPWSTCLMGQGVGLQRVRNKYHGASGCQRRKGTSRFQEEAPCGTQICMWGVGCHPSQVTLHSRPSPGHPDR